jgi:hypothetical protein
MLAASFFERTTWRLLCLLWCIVALSPFEHMRFDSSHGVSVPFAAIFFSNRGNLDSMFSRKVPSFLGVGMMKTPV